MNFSEFLLSPPRNWSGVFTVLGLGVIGNLVSGVIAAFTGNNIWITAIWVISIVLLILGFFLVRQKAKPLVLVPIGQQPPRHRGLILLVGTGRPGEDPMQQSAGIAIQYHLKKDGGNGLEACWLIASAGEKGSLGVAQQLEEICKTKNVIPIIHTVADPFGVQDAYELVDKIYRIELQDRNLPEREVISDFTGGTKPMTAGMVLACGDSRPMQYMYGRKEGIASTPRLVEFRAR